MAVKHTFRWKDGTRTEMLTPLKALRRRCLDCSNWSTQEVRLCLATECAAWVFRLGKDPSIRREFTAEQREAAAERAALMRQTRLSKQKESPISP